MCRRKMENIEEEYFNTSTGSNRTTESNISTDAVGYNRDVTKGGGKKKSKTHEHDRGQEGIQEAE